MNETSLAPKATASRTTTGPSGSLQDSHSHAHRTLAARCAVPAFDTTAAAQARGTGTAAAGLPSPTLFTPANQANHTPISSSSNHRLPQRHDPDLPARHAALPQTPRAPNPAKKVTAQEKDELHSAISAQVVAEAAVKAANTSPPSSPTIMQSSKAATRADRGPIMAHRTASIDSTVSSISSVASASQRPNHANALRVSQDNQGPQDAAALIAAAGSAEEALKKVLAEKQQAANHNAQLWRLVEKQRAMILGLNKDLEKSLKEKERYRRKLKESLSQSTSAPALITSTDQALEGDSRETSQSPSQLVAGSEVLARDISVDTRKNSDTSGSVPNSVGRSDTPQDATNPSGSGLPATPQSASSITQGQRDLPIVGESVPLRSEESKAAIATLHRAPGGTPPMSPKLVEVAYSPKSGHHKNASASSFQMSPPPSAHSFSSPKTRKAPPAPLKLDPLRPDPAVVNNIVDASDSEYEDDPESARSEFMERGRRKTREDDDREREVLLQREEEQRSRSKKEKKSKSRPAEQQLKQTEAAAVSQPAVAGLPAPEAAKSTMFQPTANPADIIRNRAVSDAANAMQRTLTAPSGLLSPGLPMSPRPGDRPLNSPMPRAANSSIANSMPLSPRSGMAGLPLSPRQPRQAIPLPPQTPMALMSPHLDRAKAYNVQQQPMQTQPPAAAVERLRPTTDASSDHERPSISSEHSSAYTPGEVYKGLVTEQYPDLLLPPNALPSIIIKTASSRMIRSRASMILPRPVDENPVFTIAVYARSDNKELWRAEKTFTALATLDHEVKSLCRVHDRLPDKALFTGHAPAKIDARRLALNHYFEKMLDSVTEEKAARIVCKFLSTDAFAAEGNDYFNNPRVDEAIRPDSPATKLRPNMAGYLTKRGKNFGGWKARYFVLDGPNLKYFEGPGGAHLGSIKLQNAQIGKQSINPNQSSTEDEDNQFRHAFLVLEPKKKDSSSLVRHVLCAESDDERDLWVDALLHYVDFRDEEESQQPGRQAQMFKTEISAPRSPRPQKSMSDLRPGSSKDATLDSLRAVGYGDTIAGDAPVMGPPATPRVAQTPSPPHDKLTSGADVANAPHPMISGPTNLQVIQNTGDWGMRVPPTPGRDKKRSMFQIPFTRGRSSSDLDTKDTAKTSSDRAYSTRAVFGVPLAEAVEFSRPDGVNTELPSVVYRCIEYLTAKKAIAEEGIFRLSGSNTVIRALKDRFNAEGDVDLLSEDNYYDVHAVASLLKLYLRELPASILTRDLHLDFLHCLEMRGEEKIPALNALVNKLPRPNRALLEAMSAFMLLIVNNVDVNRMNVRNLGVVFSPTLNLPGPLISLFVEEQKRIFDTATESADSPTSVYEVHAPAAPSGDLRSPRKQMFQDLPTPAYNQTQFQNLGGFRADDTGMIPMQPSYANYQMAPQGDGGFGSLNDALRSPTVYNTTGTGAPTPREIKQRRRESAMLHVMAPTKKASSSRLREEQGTSF